NYQAVIRDNNGNPLPATSFLLEASVFPAGDSQAVYSENHTAITNEFGLLTILIGEGELTQGDFNTINWGSQAYELEIKANGEVLPRNPIAAVPIALWAKHSGDW